IHLDNTGKKKPGGLPEGKKSGPRSHGYDANVLGERMSPRGSVLEAKLPHRRSGSWAAEPWTGVGDYSSPYSDTLRLIVSPPVCRDNRFYSRHRPRQRWL
ncbi:hypothetical protein NHX12_013924, partial [Muraenolepis orangiensis]